VGDVAVIVKKQVYETTYSYNIDSIFFISFSFGQSIDSVRLKKKAFKNYSACLKSHEEKKIKKYEKYVHPTIIKQVGKEKLLLKNDSNIKIRERSISEIGKIHFDNQAYQFTFTETNISDVVNKEKVCSYTVIAMSYDKGKNWVFFNAYDSIEKMKEDIPELSSNLKVKNIPIQNFQF
jgi:hypothetical protein